MPLLPQILSLPGPPSNAHPPCEAIKTSLHGDPTPVPIGIVARRPKHSWAAVVGGTKFAIASTTSATTKRLRFIPAPHCGLAGHDVREDKSSPHHGLIPMITSQL